MSAHFIFRNGFSRHFRIILISLSVVPSPHPAIHRRNSISSGSSSSTGKCSSIFCILASCDIVLTSLQIGPACSTYMITAWITFTVRDPAAISSNSDGFLRNLFRCLFSSCLTGTMLVRSTDIRSSSGINSLKSDISSPLSTLPLLQLPELADRSAQSLPD